MAISVKGESRFWLLPAGDLGGFVSRLRREGLFLDLAVRALLAGEGLGNVVGTADASATVALLGEGWEEAQAAPLEGRK